jgi:hypothetical protein
LPRELASETTIQVERGVVFPRFYRDESAPLASFDRLVRVTMDHGPAEILVVDAAGHCRPVYKPLLIYSWLSTFILADRRRRREAIDWIAPLKKWSEWLAGTVRSFGFSNEAVPADRGAAAGSAAWAALALGVATTALAPRAASKALAPARVAAPASVAAPSWALPQWKVLCAGFFDDLVTRQQASGAFLRPTASDNPETLWYHELILLHAVGSYALQSGDSAASRAAGRNAMFHLKETQPDHATSQPWGLSSFMAFPAAWSLADQIIHSIRLQNPDAPDGVTLTLLQDVLNSMLDFEGRSEAIAFVKHDA